MLRHSKALLSKRMLILSEAEVRQCFPVAAAIECNRKALSSLLENGDGGAMVPSRIGLPYNPGDACSSTDWSLFKPAAYYPPNNTKKETENNIIMGMKAVSVRANNPSIGKPTAPATIMLLNPATGEVSSIMGATYLTAARTAAGSALATELALSNVQSKDLTLVIFGAGLQAELHIKSIQHVLRVKNVVIINRTLERAEKLKQDLQSESEAQCDSITTITLSDHQGVREAIQNADIIVAATNTCEPLFDGKLLKPGCHVNGVGSFTPHMKELDDTLVQRCEVIIDTPEALEVGDLSWLKANINRVPNNTGLIGDALMGHFEFGKLRNDSAIPQIDCTFFKSCGTAIQDVVSAQYVYDLASRKDIGYNMEM